MYHSRVHVVGQGSCSSLLYTYERPQNEASDTSKTLGSNFNDKISDIEPGAVEPMMSLGYYRDQSESSQ